MMESCINCESLEKCDSLGIPKEVVSRVVDLIEKKYDNAIIESIIINELNYPINSRKHSVKMLI